MKNDPGPLVPDPEPRSPGAPALANLSLRVVGRVIDGIVLTAPVLLWDYVLDNPGASAASSRIFRYLLVLAFWFANDVGLTAISGSSIGKRICGTKVVFDEGRPITMAAAAVRWFVMVILTVIPLGIVADAAYMLSGDRNQTLHDRAARTIVVRMTV